MSAQLANDYNGITISDIEISHLLYVDEVVLLSPWDSGNAIHIFRILHFFFLTSGLKTNVHKKIV